MGKLTHTLIGTNGSGVTRPLIQLALGLVLGASAFSQSAKNFNTKAVAPNAKPARQEKAAVPASKDAMAANSTPSRFVGETDIEAYVKSMSALLAMRGRASDPFGQLQDPDARPVIKTSVAKKPGRVAPVQAVPLSDYIQRIKITTIMPGEKQFLVGTRKFKLGDMIHIVFRNKSTELKITSVTSNQIDFRNTETGETASLKTNILPIGMTPGTRGISAPGMVPDRPDSPINLDEASPLEESQNR